MPIRFVTFAVLKGVIVGLLVALFIKIILALPIWSYYVVSPRIEPECRSITPGSSIAALNNHLAHVSPPEEALLLGNRIQLVRDTQVCIVELDATNQHVVSSHIGGNVTK